MSYSTAELSYGSLPLASTSSSSKQATILLETPLRSDAREPLSYRDIILETTVSDGAIGSARVVVESIQGSTEIWAGVRGEVEDIILDDASDHNGMGKVVVSVEWYVCVCYLSHALEECACI